VGVCVEAFITFLTGLGFSQMMIFIIVTFFLMLIYRKATDGEFYSELYDIKDKIRSRLWGFIRHELRVVESTSLENTRKVIETLDIGNYCTHDNMMDLYRASLERSLYVFLFEDIKTSMRENGFHDLVGAELDQYIKDRSEVVLSVSRILILDRCSFLAGTDDGRFNLEGAMKFYGKIVKKSIDLKVEQDKEIKELRIKYSLIENIKKLFAKN